MKNQKWIIIILIIFVIYASSEREKMKKMEGLNLVNFRTTDLTYPKDSAIAYTDTCGQNLIAYGYIQDTPIALSGYCNESVPIFNDCGNSPSLLIPSLPGGWMDWEPPPSLWGSLEDGKLCICTNRRGNRSALRIYDTTDSDASKVDTIPTSTYASRELICAGNQTFDCPSITSPGTYYLENDILQATDSICINIESNDVVLDCQGHLIQGVASLGNTYGIRISRPTEQNTNITIKNCIVEDWQYGIHVENSNNNNLFNIIAKKCRYAAFNFKNSDYNNIDNCKSLGNENYAGFNVFYSDYNTFSNVVSAEAIAYGMRLKNVKNTLIRDSVFKDSWHWDFYQQFDWYEDTTQDIYCDNTIINTVGTGGYPIEYYNYAVTLENKRYAALILCNADDSILRNIIIDAYDGDENDKNRNNIFVYHTDGALFDNIRATRTYDGILLYKSNSNTITNSYFKEIQYDSIQFLNSDNNIIKNSEFYVNDIQLGSRNNEIGIDGKSMGNEFYNNYMYDGQIPGGYPYGLLFGLNPSSNIWNTDKEIGTRIYGAGDYIGGNYWATADGTGYSETCIDDDGDNFCDEPLVLETGNTDYLPLTNTITYRDEKDNYLDNLSKSLLDFIFVANKWINGEIDY